MAYQLRHDVVFARLKMMPRVVRLSLTFLTILWGVGFFVVPLATLALLPFDPPGILLSGPWQAATFGYTPLISLVMALPLFFGFALDEDRADWRGVRKAIGRGMTWLVLAPFLYLFGAIPMIFICFLALPFVSNAILRPPVQSWDVPVIGSDLGMGRPKTCPNQLTFADPYLPTQKLDICARTKDSAFAAKVGDRLRITGRKGPFGITYTTVELLPKAP